MTVVESADAIAEAVEAITFDDYSKSRLIRAAVEREFITIGEALNSLSRIDSGCSFASTRRNESSAFATSSPTSTTEWMTLWFGVSFRSPCRRCGRSDG